ncbi:hydrolase [Streptomyces bingchenggensis BCW-1]|uniref:Hydrolase n=1 Tax=Streptomyces bingchenggensis (strain BCW-1) TaxID=749414 RepID=D7CD00_STRBB|nr:Cof-type HAD-IIB family hydrolase [Streptomyces milbemycinicus]ADI10847.1 hydrolase [Streptomyces bingchenggensis BCW-1]
MHTADATPAPDTALRLPRPRSGSAPFPDSAELPGSADPPPFRLVATDLDGTLLRTDLTVSARTRAALALADRAGARHLVVTGRPAASCREFLVAIGYQGLAVCGQGAQLYDASADRLLFSAALDLDLARAVVKRTEEELGGRPLELAVVTAAPENRFVITPRFTDRMRPDWGLVGSREELWAQPIEKVLMRHRELPDGRVAAAAALAGGDEVSVTHSEKGMIEVLPAGVDKAVGLGRAAERMGFAPEDTIAFGDMPNDIPMLKWAGYGVAMGNAHPGLIAVADEVAPDHDEDGVAAVLERVYGRP